MACRRNPRAVFHVSVFYRIRSNELFDTESEFIPLEFETDSWVKAKLIATDHIQKSMWKIRSPLHKCNDAIRILAHTPRWTKVNDTRFIKSNKKAGVTIQLTMMEVLDGR